MTQDEYNEAAALVVRLRKDLELHTDALKQSNAQCAEYLRKTEQMQAENERLLRVHNDHEDAAADMHRELVNVRAALASVTEQRDSLRRTLDEWERADTKPNSRLDPLSVDFSPDPAPAFMMRVQFSATPPVKVDDVADHVVPPVLPLCNVCHGCGTALTPHGTVLRCPNQICGRTNTGTRALLFNPYHDTCKSPTTVRHE